MEDTGTESNESTNSSDGLTEITGTVTREEIVKFGDYSRTFEYGEDDCLTQADGLSTDINGADQKMSVVFWMNPESETVAGSYKYIFGKYDTDYLTDRQFNMGTYDGARLLMTISGDGEVGGGASYVSSYTTTGLISEHWYHIAVVYDDSTLKFYVNGVEEDSDSYSAGIYNSGQAFTVGCRTDGGVVNAEYDGILDDFGIFDTDLSSADVNDIMDNGLIQDPPTTFAVDICSSGCDWTALTNAEQALDIDITPDTVKVFSFDANSGTIPDSTACTTDGGSTTGTCQHQSDDQILISAISGGTFDDNDVVSDGTNTVTLSDSGDDARIELTVYSDVTGVTWEGGKYNNEQYMKISGDTTGVEESAWDGTTAGGVNMTATGWGGMRLHDPYITFENFVLTCDSGFCLLVGDIDDGGDMFVNNVILDGGGIGNTSLAYSYAYIFNSVSLDSAGDCIDTHYNSGNIYTYNFTCYNPAGYGLNEAYRAIWAYNTAVFDSVSGDFESGVDGDYWACSDTSCNVVTNYDASLTATDELVSPSTGDVHLKAGSTLIDAGGDYSWVNGVGWDLDFTTVTDTWDVGADEYEEAVGGERRMFFIM